MVGHIRHCNFERFQEESVPIPRRVEYVQTCLSLGLRHPHNAVFTCLGMRFYLITMVN